MKLVAFGDSWVFGDELGDMSNEYRNTFNIGGVINKHYKFEDYINYSVNGGSNDHIVSQLAYYLNSHLYNETDVIIIGLTSPLRKLRFNNISKTTTVWPGWDYNSFNNYCHESLRDNSIFREWWRLNLIVDVNQRNDAFHYFETCMSIKGLLTNHKKYIVWQSIDDEIYKIENDFIELEAQYDKIGFETADYNTEIFDKAKVNKLLTKNLLETQVWINITEPVWLSWLKTNFNRYDVLVPTSDHPNEYGNQLWFDNILKKYLDKII